MTMTLTEALDYVGRQRPAWMTAKGSWREPFTYNRAHIIRLLGAQKKVHKITRADLARMRNTLLSESVSQSGKKRSVGSVNRVMSMLSTLLRELHENEIIPAIPKLRALKENNERTAYYKRDQFDELISRARAKGDKELATAILFGGLTGCRQSELLQLKVGDVDLAGNELIFRDTKNGDDFITNLHADLKEPLRELIEGKQRDETVFNFRNDDHLRDDFYAIRDEMGLGAEYVWHSIRHSTGTWLADAGVPIQTISSVLNHSNIQTSARYVKRTNAARKAAIDLL